MSDNDMCFSRVKHVDSTVLMSDTKQIILYSSFFIPKVKTFLFHFAQRKVFVFAVFFVDLVFSVFLPAQNSFRFVRHVIGQRCALCFRQDQLENCDVQRKQNRKNQKWTGGPRMTLKSVYI